MSMPRNEHEKRIARADRRDSAPGRQSVLPVLLVFVPLLIASIGMSGRVGDLRRIASARTWPVASGIVLEARVDEGNRTRASTSYVEVEIEYAVEGRTFLARGLRTTGEPMTMDRAEASRPRAGSTMNLRYDPRDPARATIVTDWTRDDTLLAIGIASCWFATFAASLILFPRIRAAIFGRRTRR